MKIAKSKTRDLFIGNKGFTIIELISVLVILGIMTAYVAKTSTDLIDTSKTISQINQVKAHLKYAQIKSLNSNGFWGIDFTGSTYALFRFDTTPPAAIDYEYFPGNEKTIATPTKADCEMEKPDSSKYITYAEYIWFDKLGCAHKSATYTTSINTVAEIAASLNIVTLTSGTSIISIQPKTGYIKCDYK